DPPGRFRRGCGGQVGEPVQVGAARGQDRVAEFGPARVDERCRLGREVAIGVGAGGPGRAPGLDEFRAETPADGGGAGAGVEVQQVRHGRASPNVDIMSACRGTDHRTQVDTLSTFIFLGYSRAMELRSDLLTGTTTPPERTDAARNRAKVLAAAAELFATRDPRTVTMDDIAKAAGVGRGTLYRRYPDRTAIAVALLDEHERALQQHLLSGEPPLGPGAPPAERLAAFYAAMVE